MKFFLKNYTRLIVFGRRHGNDFLMDWIEDLMTTAPSVGDFRLNSVELCQMFALVLLG